MNQLPDRKYLLTLANADVSEDISNAVAERFFDEYPLLESPNMDKLTQQFLGGQKIVTIIGQKTDEEGLVSLATACGDILWRSYHKSETPIEGVKWHAAAGGAESGMGQATIGEVMWHPEIMGEKAFNAMQSAITTSTKDFYADMAKAGFTVVESNQNEIKVASPQDIPHAVAIEKMEQLISNQVDAASARFDAAMGRNVIITKTNNLAANIEVTGLSRAASVETGVVVR